MRVLKFFSLILALAYVLEIDFGAPTVSLRTERWNPASPIPSNDPETAPRPTFVVDDQGQVVREAPSKALPPDDPRYDGMGGSVGDTQDKILKELEERDKRARKELKKLPTVRGQH